jgi:O-antigen/teichoic acid export membrane protein
MKIEIHGSDRDSSIINPSIVNRPIPPSPDHSRRTVARNFLALGSGEAVSRLIAFAATVYIARALGASLYGVIGFATAVMLYLSHVADAGIELGIGVREIAAAPSRLAAIASPLLTGRLLLAAALALLTALLGLLLLPEPDGAVLAIYGLTLLAVGGSSRWVHYGLDRTALVAITRAAGQVVVLLLVLALVRGPGDVAAVPAAQVVGDTLVALVLLWWLSRGGVALPVRLDGAVIRPLLPRAGHMVLSAMLGLMIFNSDLIFLRAFRTTTEVGYYAAAYTVISFSINLGLAYSLSLLPSLTRLSGATGEQRALYHTAMAHVFAAGFPAALGGYLLAPRIVGLIFGPGYAPAGPALQVLMWSIPLSLVRDVPIIGLMSQGREAIVLRVTGWATALNLGLNLLLIPSHGMIGAALATVITEGARMVIALLFARAAGFPFAPAARFWRPIVAGLTMAGLLVVGRSLNLWLALPLGLASYLAALVLVGGVRFERGAAPSLSI